MIEASRKHGAFDLRWPTLTECARERAADKRAEAVFRPYETRAAEAWETEGGAALSEPAPVRAGSRLVRLP